MLYYITAAISLLIIVPAVVGWARFRYIDQSYRPLVYLLTLGFINEVISVYSVFRYGTNTINYNIFVLVETQLVLWQLRNWDDRGKSALFYRGFATVFIIIWFAEWVWRGSISQFFSFFIITHGLCISLLSLSIIGSSFFHMQNRLLKDPVFLVCSGFVIYYTYMAMLEVYWVFGYAHNSTITWWVNILLSIINFFINFVYCFSLLCIPRSRQFIFPRL